MANNQYLRKWSELGGIAVTIPSEGKQAGTVDDFYFEPETNAVRGLRINIGILGYRALQTNTISTIERYAVTIPNENVLILERDDRRLPELLLGHSLLSYKVMSERGTVVGTVGNILLDTSRPRALRVAAFELAGDRSGQRFSAHQVTHYERDAVVILDKVAKALR